MKKHICSKMLNLKQMLINDYIIEAAVDKAANGHNKKKEVQDMLKSKEKYILLIKNLITSGAYKQMISYRRLTKTNTNGKVRNIDSPDLLTRVLQHVALQLLLPIYNKHDNKNGLNCKEGCGISAKDRNKSVIKKMKHMVYDRRDLHYVLIIDQRKCYDHITPKVFRKEAKKLGYSKDVIDYTIDVGFVRKHLPIGTPTSPLIHHIVMLSFDHWSKQASHWSLRYADDNIYATETLSEAHKLKWRVMNYWWYELQIRANRSIRIQPLTKEISLCGYVFHRNQNKLICDHDKGFTTLRQNIKIRAIHCNNNNSWGSYFGILTHADDFKLTLKIQTDMKLQNLTENVKIKREMDAKTIAITDLEGKVFTIYKYDIRRNEKDGIPNWIKCLIGMKEVDAFGNETGRMKAYEFHGGYHFLIEFLIECEKKYQKNEMLPIEDCKIINQCGYIFEHSTQQHEYIPDEVLSCISTIKTNM